MNGNHFPACGYFGSAAKLEWINNENLLKGIGKLQEGFLINYQSLITT